MDFLRAAHKSCWGVRSCHGVQLLCGIFAFLLLSLPAFPQGSTGRILGTVTDQSGGVVDGATVTVIDTERGTTRTLTTDDAGAYNAPNLTPGNYTVRAEAKGFKRIERQGITIEVGHEVRVDLTVQPGEQNQTVTVTESAPLVETTTATMGGTLENADIVDLPLNGRDYQNLLSLRPGIQLYPGGGPWTQSSNGTRPDESVWMVDGVINFNPFDARPLMNMPGPFQDAATILPIDAIQEFNTMENPKAEYGWKSGAIVNVGIKSGTNSLHGDAYAFGRTSSWDARNYFNVGEINGVCVSNPGLPAACDQSAVAVKQFGSVVGGPIKKDKLFFFAGYEGFRDSIGDDYSLTTPATASLGNPGLSIVDAINGDNAAGVPVSTVSLNAACPNAIGQALPLPTTFVCKGAGPQSNATGGSSGGLFPDTSTGSFLSFFPIVSHSDNGIGKLDWHPNDKSTVSGTFWYSKYDALGEDHGFTNANFTDTTPITALTTDASWVYTPNSTLVNELRFGYDRVSFEFVNQDINDLANGTGVYSYINTGAPTGGFPTVHLPPPFPSTTLGTNSNRPQTALGNPYWDIQDNVSILKGKNSFKFGGEYTHSEADSAIVVDGRGLINFSGGGAFANSTALEDFMAGTPSGSPAASLLTGNASVQTHWSTASLFLQDDWRATSKLIINAGLRWGFSSPMQATNDAFGNFNPAIGLTQEGFNGLQSGGDWNPYYRSFDPRIGFAYDVTGKGTTVIRAGVGVVHTMEWPLLSWDGQFGLQNDGATSLAADPTGAILQCSGSELLGIGINCPSTGGGTITLGAASFSPGQLCWDPAITTNGACHTNALTPGAQTTVFPVTSKPTCGDGLPGDASPCDVMGVNPNLINPYVVTYNLGITHQIGQNLSIEIAYVGDHGYDLLSFTDANQAPLGAAYCLNTLTAAQLADACRGGPKGVGQGSSQAIQEARPFFTKYPYLGFINFASNGGYANYNSLQTTITRRMSHGLSFVAGYTYAHGLDNGSINRFGPLPQDSTDLANEYASSDFDIRHRLTITGTYDIPGKKGFSQLLEGWELNAIYSYSTPQPWEVWDPADDISGTGENADRWNIVGNPLDFPAGVTSIPFCGGFTPTGGTSAVSCAVVNPYGTPQTYTPTTAQLSACISAAGNLTVLSSIGCYVPANGHASAIAPPALGSFGDMGRNILRDAGFNNLDFSIFKNFSLRERYKFQFRWEVFNVLNHPIPANPYGSSSFVDSGNTFPGPGLGFAGVTNDFAAGNPLIGSGSQRVMQLGLKINF